MPVRHYRSPDNRTQSYLECLLSVYPGLIILTLGKLKPRVAANWGCPNIKINKKICMYIYIYCMHVYIYIYNDNVHCSHLT